MNEYQTLTERSGCAFLWNSCNLAFHCRHMMPIAADAKELSCWYQFMMARADGLTVPNPPTRWVYGVPDFILTKAGREVWRGQSVKLLEISQAAR